MVLNLFFFIECLQVVILNEEVIFYGNKAINNKIVNQKIYLNLANA
jgi:hypothetical protein